MTHGVLLAAVSPVLVAWLLAHGYAIFVTLCSLAVEEWAYYRHERWRELGFLVLASVAENIGYRQLTVIWRLEGRWAGVRNKKQVWGVMTRTGFGEAGS